MSVLDKIIDSRIYHVGTKGDFLTHGSAPARRGRPSNPSVHGPARLIGLKDAGYPARLAWLHEWLPDADAFAYEETNTRLLAQAERPFRFLVLHGNDLRRMGRIIRDWRSIFPSKLIVALMSQSTPPERAELLRLGADNVFDLDTPSVVAEATLANTIKRWMSAQSTGNCHSNPTIKLRHPLTRTEEAIAAVLCEYSGEVVPYAAILTRIGKANSRGAVKCLQVQMQRLRSKVVSGLLIENRTSVGYRASLN